MPRNSNLPATTAKDINDAHRMACRHAEDAVAHAIKCGQLLIQIQAKLDRGCLEAWVEKNTDVGWSTARLYMTAARKNENGIAFQSLRHCFPSGKETKKDQSSAPSKLLPPLADCAKTAAEKSPFLPPEKPDSAVPQTVKYETAKPAIQAPVAAPVATSPTEEPERPDDIDEDAALASAEADLARRMDAVLSGDEKLAAAVSQLKQQSHLIGILETTRDGYMRGKEEVTRMLKSEQRKSERLERENKKLQEELESLRERIAIMECA